MPANAKPPATPGDIYCLLETSLLGAAVEGSLQRGVSGGVLKPQPGNGRRITPLRTRGLVVFFNPLAMPGTTQVYRWKIKNLCVKLKLPVANGVMAGG